MQFKYTKNPHDQVPIIVVDKHIGSDKENGEGIMGSQFLDEVFELKRNGTTAAEVWVNSPGGSMIEGMNIEGAIGLSGVKFDTLNYGIAASAGGTIWLKGAKARMTPNAIFMCHDPSGANEDESSSEQRTFTESVAIKINEGSGRNGHPKISVEDAKKLMKETTFLTAQECFDMGLCDEVVPSDYETTYTPVTANDFYLAGNNILNSLLPKNNTMAENTNLLLITNELELSEEAAPQAMAKAIKGLKAKANRVDVLEVTNASLTQSVADLTAKKNEMADEMENKDASMAEKDNAIEDMKNQLAAKENEATALRDKINAFEVSEAQRKEEDDLAATKKNEADCMNMVNSFKNKLGNDADYIATWVNTAKTLGIDAAKDMLEKLPFSGKAPTIREIVTKVDVSNTYVDDNGMTPAQKLMAKKAVELKEKRNRATTSVHA